MVEGDGFEPSKAEPADLQSAPFGHSGTPPRGLRITYSLSRHLTDVFPTHQSRISLAREYGGGGRIRTIEGGAGRFTVCSLWPLGNPSRGLRITYSLSRHLTDVFPTHQLRISLAREYGGGGRIRTIEGGAGRFTVCSLWPLGNPSRGLRITYSLSRHLTDVFPTHQSRISLAREYGGGDGFEPSKAEPADLQSAPFGHSGTPPRVYGLTRFNPRLNRRFPNASLSCGAHIIKLGLTVNSFLMILN